MNRILSLLLLGALVCTGAAAQTETPSTETMIRQLQAPRTRGITRNLFPERVPAAGAAAAGSGTPAVAAPAESAATGASTVATSTTASGTAQAGTNAAPAIEVARPSLSLLIQFDFDSARVRPESREALTNLSQALLSAELRESRFLVEGHTDAKGSAEYNQRLSTLRALAVRDYLKAQGVDEARLQAAGRGASELANSTEPYAAQNRRVRIVNIE